MKKLLLLALLPMCGWTGTGELFTDMGSALAKFRTLPQGPLEGTSVTFCPPSGTEDTLGRLDEKKYQVNIRVFGKVVAEHTDLYSDDSLIAFWHTIDAKTDQGAYVRDLLVKGCSLSTVFNQDTKVWNCNIEATMYVLNLTYNKSNYTKEKEVFTREAEVTYSFATFRQFIMDTLKQSKDSKWSEKDIVIETSLGTRVYPLNTDDGLAMALGSADIIDHDGKYVRHLFCHAHPRGSPPSYSIA
jgi:hypothetical protein